MSKKINIAILSVLVFGIVYCSFFYNSSAKNNDYYSALATNNYEKLDGKATASDIVKQMGNGINLGNTFDVTDSSLGTSVSDEVLQTGWGTKSLVWQNQSTNALEVDTKLIDELYEKGIRSIRIPCSWDYHVTFSKDSNGNYIVSPIKHNQGDKNKDGFNDFYNYFEKVDKLVDYITKKGMYVILDIHHPYTDTSETTNLRKNSWEDPIESNYEEAIKKIKAYWAYIADYYKKYDSHLVFELFNEIRDRDLSKSKLPEYNYTNAYEWAGKYSWSGSSKIIEEYFKILNDYNAVAVDTVRNTGDNNKYRLILIPTYANSADDYAMKYVSSAISEAKGDTNVFTPDNVDSNNSCDKSSSFCHKNLIGNQYLSLNDQYLAVAIHAYTPNSFTQTSNNDTTYSDEVKQSLNTLFKNISSNLVDNNIPVLITEFGAINKNNTQEREKYVKDYVSLANSYGSGLIKVFWWDSGTPFLMGTEGYSIIYRTLTANSNYEKALPSYSKFVNQADNYFQYSSNLYALNTRTNIVNNKVNWDFSKIVSYLATKSSDSPQSCKNNIKISFILDDAHVDSEELISKINSYGYKAGLAVITNYADSATNGTASNYLNWTKIKSIFDNGNEILSHSVSHANNIYWTNKYGTDKMISLDDAKIEATNSKKIIEQHLGSKIFGFVVPQNTLDDDYYNIIKTAAYTDVYGSSNTNNNIITRTLYSSGSQSKWYLKSVSEIENDIDEAVTSGSNKVYYFHNKREMPLSDLEAILNYIKANKCVSVVRPNSLNNVSPNPDVPKITIVSPKTEIYEGEQLQLSASLSNASSTNINWKISDGSLASIESDGNKAVVTGLKSGKIVVNAYITVNNIEISDSFELTINEDKITINSNVSSENTYLSLNEKLKLNPTITVQSGQNYNIGYDSSDDNVLTVNDSGLIVGKNVGCSDVTITATVVRNNFKKSAKATIPFCVVEPQIKVDKDISLYVSEKKKLNITTDVDVQDYSIDVKVLDSSIASISDDKQYIIGKNIGSTKLIVTLTINATKIVKESTVTIKEKNNSDISIKFDKKILTIFKGKTDKIKVIVTPSEKEKMVSFKSDNNSIASIDEQGNITSKNVGTTAITAYIEENSKIYSTKCTIIVLPNVEEFPASISYEKTVISVGEKQIANIGDDFKNSKIKYLSSNKKIATVDDNGVVIGISSGYCTITATLDGTNISRKFDFVINDSNNSITENPNTKSYKSISAYKICKPKITYSTTNKTISKVIAVVNFANENCHVTNNSNSNSKVFTKNGKFTFEYVGSDNIYGKIDAKVLWIKSANDVTAFKNSRLKYFIITLIVAFVVFISLKIVKQKFHRKNS